MPPVNRWRPACTSSASAWWRRSRASATRRPARSLPHPGLFRRSGKAGTSIFEVATRPAPVLLSSSACSIADDRITKVTRSGQDAGAVALEPEVLSSATDRPGEDHKPIRLDEAPKVLIDAVLAAEDHRFFAHGGLDPARAAPRRVGQPPRRPGQGRRQHDHAAAREGPAPQPAAHVLPQAAGSVAGRADRVALLEGANPRGLPERDLSGAAWAHRASAASGRRRARTSAKRSTS